METTIDIYRCLNGIYKSNVLFTTLEIEDAFQSTEIDQFCEEHNCNYDGLEECVLYCNDTHVVLYHVK